MPNDGTAERAPVHELNRALGKFGKVKMARWTRGLRIAKDHDELAQIEAEVRAARKQMKEEVVHEDAAVAERANDKRVMHDAKVEIAALIGMSRERARSTQRALQRTERAFNTPTREALLGFSATANMRGNGSRSPSPVRFMGEASRSVVRSVSPIKPRVLGRSFSPLQTSALSQVAGR